MSGVFSGRFTGKAPTDATALFLLGMRANSVGGLRRTVPVAAAMGRMLRHLAEHPEAGLLSYQNWFGRTTILVSYWRSAADVQRFASDPTAPHAPAWQKFNRQLQANKGVGIWHELYTVRPGDFEGIYSNCRSLEWRPLVSISRLAMVGEPRNSGWRLPGRLRPSRRVEPATRKPRAPRWPLGWDGHRLAVTTPGALARVDHSRFCVDNEVVNSCPARMVATG